MRLICDEMLAPLGALAACRLDTEIAERDVSDRALVARRTAEARLLLTRDGHLAEPAAARRLNVVEAPQLRRDIDWQAARFTRCLLDNAVFGARRPPHAGAARIVQHRTGLSAFVWPRWSDDQVAPIAAIGGSTMRQSTQKQPAARTAKGMVFADRTWVS